MEDKMIIEYTAKIDNWSLGYCLYLDNNNGLEYWYDYNTQKLHLSNNAGDSISEATEDEYELKEVFYG